MKIWKNENINRGQESLEVFLNFPQEIWRDIPPGYTYSLQLEKDVTPKGQEDIKNRKNIVATL